ncbi:hypothetical protein ACFY9A_01270 [Streptomyces rubradiris]|uniref:hypothetical protein n=1 Tax=Streptomyces rubradiris TaxID=285531 RepID=UPI0036E8A382
MADSRASGTAPPRHQDTREVVLFGGVYGAVLASSMVAALTRYGHTSADVRGYDAAWVLVTACASALAHGYAHYIAERTPHHRWDALLAGARWELWPAKGVEYAAFVLNIVILFGLGLVTARWSARGWPAAVLVGLGDALLGLIVVVANALIK